jgi:hypothetical protein
MELNVNLSSFFVIPNSYRLNTIKFSKIYDKLLFDSIVFHSFDLGKFRFNWFDFENLLVIVSALTLIEQSKNKKTTTSHLIYYVVK